MVLVATPKQPDSIHHKRRHGHHHKTNKRYHDTYWPYLPLATIVGLGIVLNTFWGTIQQAVLGYATDMSISGLLQETNNERIANGLPALAVNSQLNQAAQAKANDMSARNYWSHYTPDGTPPWQFISDAGYGYQTAGENLAYGFDSSDAAVTGWMGSPGHRANILQTNFQDVGFGIANVADYQSSGEQTIVVAMYGKLAGASTPVAAAAKPTPTAPKPTAAPVATQSTPAPSQPAEQPKELNTTPDVVTANGGKPKAVQAEKVSRIQLISTTQASWSAFAVSSLAIIAAAIFFLKHAVLWHRFLLRGERFVLKHRFLDAALVLIVVGGVILTRSAGIIH